MFKYVNERPVTASDLDVLLPQFDEAVGNLSAHPVKGTITEIGGLPSIRYDDVEVEGSVPLQSRLAFIFDERDQYLLNCQSTPARRQELNAACDRVLETLAHR